LIIKIERGTRRVPNYHKAFKQYISILLLAAAQRLGANLISMSEPQIQSLKKTRNSRHFKLPLSEESPVRFTAIDKWRSRVTASFTMPDGGLKQYSGPAETIIIRRGDIIRVHDYARVNCEPRDYLLIRLPMKIGLRTGEICTLRIENIDFQSRTFQVLDSKRKKLYPLPLDPVTLELIRLLIGKRLDGYVFRQRQSWTEKCASKPLQPATVWIRVNTIAKEAGVDNFNPRLLRHFFATEWHRSGRSLEVLRRILRHKSLAYTQFYLARLVFFEDIQQTYDEVMSGPFQPDELNAHARLGPCANCNIVNVCKYAGSLPEHAVGCRYKPKLESDTKIE